jgi:hypothetical protein
MKHIANVQYNYKLTVPNHYHKNKPSHSVKPKIVVFHFVLFLLAIMLSVLLRYTDSVTPNPSYLQQHYIDCSKMELGLNNPITS